MQEDLQFLLDLSNVDKKVHELKLTKKDLPLRISNLKEDIEREKTKLEGTSQAIAETKAKIQENQDILAEEQTSLNESNRRLDAITTNREYDAVHSEIATHKRNIDSAQANIIHHQQMLENLLKDREEVEAVYKSVMETHEPELAVLETELGGIEDRIAEEASKAKEPREKISKKVLSVYDRVVTRRGTPNVISSINRSQKACLVCNRTQTPQRIIEISKKNALLTCESCGSILIWKED